MTNKGVVQAEMFALLGSTAKAETGETS